MTTVEERATRDREKHALALAFEAVKRYHWTGPPGKDELLSAALLGAARALARYDPAQGPFVPFAVVTIRGTIQAAVRDWLPYQRGEWERAQRSREKLPPRMLSLDVAVEEEEGQLLPDSLADTDPGRDPWEALVASEWRRLIAELPERERRAVRLYHLRGYTQTETARELGISQMQVSRLLRRAGSKLKELAEERGLD